MSLSAAWPGECPPSDGLQRSLLRNQRAVYLANKKGFNHPWSKISGIEAYSDSVEWHFANRQQSTVLSYQNPTVAPIGEYLVYSLVNQ